MKDHPDSVVKNTRWPEKLLAHVVTPELPLQIHGYDVENDLAHYYNLLEIFLLAFTGEIPHQKNARAFEIAMVFLSPESVTQGPTQASILAKLIGGSTSSILSTTLIVLAEEAQKLIRRHKLMFHLLEQEAFTYLPEEYRTDDPEERAAVTRLDIALQGTGITLPFKEFSRDSAILYTLYTAGLKTSLQLCSVVLLSRLPCIVAEAEHWQEGAFNSYPMDLPNFRYED